MNDKKERKQSGQQSEIDRNQKDSPTRAPESGEPTERGYGRGEKLRSGEPSKRHEPSGQPDKRD